MSSRLTSILRVLFAIVGLVAITFAVLWVIATVEAFQPGFNDHGGVPTGYLRKVAVLGSFGALASLLTAASALAYARTAAVSWIGAAVVCGLGAAALFTIWIDAWTYAGGVG